MSNSKSNLVGRLLWAIAGIDGELHGNEAEIITDTVFKIEDVDAAEQKTIMQETSQLDLEGLVAWIAPVIEEISQIKGGDDWKRAVLLSMTLVATSDKVTHPYEQPFIQSTAKAWGIKL
jgi:tellurite resistance protein